jgi:hypothetical protein
MTMATEPLDLDAMQAEYDVKLPGGEWRAIDEPYHVEARHLVGNENGILVGTYYPSVAAWIANAHNQMPALLAELRRLRGVETAARDVVRFYREAEAIQASNLSPEEWSAATWRNHGDRDAANAALCRAVEAPDGN